MSKRELQPRLEREGGIMREDLSDVGSVEERRRLLDWWKRREDCWIGGREEKIGGLVEEN